MKKQQSGFTLIEIAIVLVIIGLLLGGVLKGQAMMDNAKLKRTSNDFNGISAAIFSYMDRYAALPGDDPNAFARWGLSAAIASQGDGIIDGAWDANVATAESSLVWEHLRAAGLISGTGFAMPVNPFGGTFGVEDAAAEATTAIDTGSVICMNGVEGQFADILDIQLDDGVGDTGEMMNAAGDTYDDTTLTTAYVICKQL
ncbi:MAG: prepilin-type N-terminal cleavage/methylation domain-containing protein [Gammaproteobacteria bacterium]|nr:prepilin-type N-terminal cleavage/methylation domain-containing protein [Gammaproteobacteria bacterium]MCW9056970.1 prepilin-type N-terminal cleavage/methylation domain-containing protein [Gammaproteobacteria bacterium]